MDNNNMNGFTGMPQQPIAPGVPPQQPIAPGMAPQQPVMPEMTMAPQQPVQPEMTMAPQQPVQPEMTVAPEQPVQPEMTVASEQPVQSEMTVASEQPVQSGLRLATEQTTMPQMNPDMGMNPGMMPNAQAGMNPGMGMQPQMDMYGQPMQPQMDMYGQPMQPGMMPQQPMMQPNGKPAKVKKPKKPMTKGKLAAIISASVVGVAAVVCGVIFLPKLFKSDRERVLDAYEATFDSYEAINNELSEKVGAEAIEKAFQEKGGTVNSDYTFTVGDDTFSLEYAQNGTSVIDQKNKQLSVSEAIALNGADIITMNILADENNTYLEVPEIIAGYIALPNKDIFGALANSEIGKEAGLDEAFATMPKYDLDYFGALSGNTEDMQIYSGYVDAIEQVWDKAEFKKQGKAKIDVNGKTVTAKEYYVTLKKDDIVNALSSTLDGVSEAVTSNEAMLEESGMSISDYEYAMEQVKTLLPSFVTKDFVIKVYVKDGKVVKTVMKDDISLFGASLGYDIWMDTGDNDFTLNIGFSAMDEKAGVKVVANDLKGNTNGKISVFVNDESVDIDFKKTVAESGSVKTTTYEFTMTDYFTLNATYDYDNSNDSFKGTVSADIIGVDSVVADFSGKYANIQKGVGYDTVIDNLSIKIANQELMSMAMTVGIDTSKTDAQTVDTGKTIYSITEMSMDDLENMIMDSQDQIMDWVTRLSEDPAIQELVELFTANSYVDDFDDDYNEPVIEDEDPEDAILEAGEATYKVLGCIDGFELWSATSLGVEFDTESYSTIEYKLITSGSTEDAVNAYFESFADDETPATDSAYNEVADVDGAEVMYTYEVTDFYGDMPVMNLVGAVEVEPGVYMIISAYIYTDDDNLSATDVIQALSSQYFEKQ